MREGVKCRGMRQAGTCLTTGERRNAYVDLGRKRRRGKFQSGDIELDVRILVVW
jgi:hypothetical protein